MGGHGEVLKPTKYRSIHDIPDEVVPRFSKRDPDNLVYKTRRWVNFKKKQILFQQQDGVPLHLRTAPMRACYFITVGLLVGSAIYNTYMFSYYINKKP